MNILAISPQLTGLLLVLLLFVLCFVCVHFIRLARVGYNQVKKSPAPKPEPPPAQEQPPPKKEAVRYVVKKP